MKSGSEQPPWLVNLQVITVDLPLVVSINKSFWIAAGVSSVADLRQ